MHRPRWPQSRGALRNGTPTPSVRRPKALVACLHPSEILLPIRCLASEFPVARPVATDTNTQRIIHLEQHRTMVALNEARVYATRL